MDHTSVVVEDLPAAIDFFVALGLTLEGRSPIEGAWVDRLCGLDAVQVEIAMLRGPAGIIIALAEAAVRTGQN